MAGARTKSAPRDRDRSDKRQHERNARCGHAFETANRQLQFRSAGTSRRYYVDFVCRERRLIIELDGGQHSERLGDQQRDCELLGALGYRVLRIWTNDVIENLEGVLETVLSELERMPLTPALSPLAGRGS